MSNYYYIYYGLFPNESTLNYFGWFKISENSYQIKTILDFKSIGCFYDGGTYCDVFVESLSSGQCSSASSSYPVSCGGQCLPSKYYVYAGSVMTVDLCLQICTNYGYSYAGLAM